jgi:hypothetical protein
MLPSADERDVRSSAPIPASPGAAGVLVSFEWLPFWRTFTFSRAHENEVLPEFQ